jgi:dimethylhistidine N-methyltransferase
MEGLSKPEKTLPCRYFYDAEGSELFEAITRLPEYYQTRTEAAILEENAASIVRGIPDGAMMVEFGSGSSLKTELLLRRLPRLRAYVAIDVSPSALDDARARLSKRFPQLDVVTIVGDFAYPIDLPSELANAPRLGFFPGSTIGNLAPADAVDLLQVFRSLLSPGRLIVGVDVKKDTGRLVRAYDDSAGLTAAFNLNLLARINRELGAEFDLSAFQHQAVYNSSEGRIEMHLKSTRSQDVGVFGRVFHFRSGETIHTENSYKYAPSEFAALARAAGWRAEQVWTDRDNLFSVHDLLSD